MAQVRVPPRQIAKVEPLLTPAPQAQEIRLRIVRVVVTAGCWLYALAILALWGGVTWGAPDVWPLHLFYYGPRWLVVVPLVLLLPWTVWVRSKGSALALGTALVAFIGIWGFVVPWRAIMPGGGAPDRTLRLLTCNVQGSDLKTQALAELVRQVQPDVVVLQECGLNDPREVLDPGEWDVRSAGEFCVASRYPIVAFETEQRPDKRFRTIAVRATVFWSGKTFPIVAVHLMTPRAGLDAIIRSPLGGLETFQKVTDIQRSESELLRRWIAEDSGATLLAGDFNLTPEHPLYRRDWSDFRNAFSQTGWGLGHTMFTRRIGLRIDHVLCGSQWRPEACRVGLDVGSAHRPVVAVLSWEGPSG